MDTCWLWLVHVRGACYTIQLSVHVTTTGTQISCFGLATPVPHPQQGVCSRSNRVCSDLLLTLACQREWTIPVRSNSVRIISVTTQLLQGLASYFPLQGIKILVLHVSALSSSLGFLSFCETSVARHRVKAFDHYSHPSIQSRDGTV